MTATLGTNALVYKVFTSVLLTSHIIFVLFHILFVSNDSVLLNGFDNPVNGCLAENGCFIL